MSDGALNNEMTAKQSPKPLKITFFHCFENVMRNQKNYRQTFIEIVRQLFHYDVGVSQYAFSDIGFSICNKEQDFTLTIENVGCQ